MRLGHYSFRAAYEEPDSDREDHLAEARAVLAARPAHPHAAPRPAVFLSDAAYTAGGVRELIQRLEREAAAEEQRKADARRQRARDRRMTRKPAP